MLARGGPDTVEFPSFFPERRIVLQRDTTLIGRHNRDQGVEPEIDLGIHPVDRGVSTQHAVLRIRDSGLTVTDLGSTNGTSLNGSDDLLGKRRRGPTRRRRSHPRRRVDHDQDCQSWVIYPSVVNFIALTSVEGTDCQKVRNWGDFDRPERTHGPHVESLVRQHQELRDARHQSAASREILEALGRDVANPGAVLDTVVEYAARLCGARAAQLFLLDGDVFRLYAGLRATPPMSIATTCRTIRSAETARPQSGARPKTSAPIRSPTAQNDAEYGRKDLQSRTGFRTLLSTPMILQDEVVGVLSMWRTEVAPFNDHERELLEEFAAQGAIALRQVNLLRALESRGTELSSKVAQLEALREVGEAVGSSLDLDEVLDRIVGNAVRLTNRGFGDITLRTDGGSIMEYDESS